MSNNANVSASSQIGAKYKRAIQFALAGLLIALALQIVGYRFDHAVPRVTLERQALYNWLTLLSSPAAFFLRLGNPEGPIVAGWTTFFIVLFSNAILYAAFCRVCQLFLLRLRHKLAFEDISLVTQRHPERVIPLASPDWRPRRL